MDLRLFQCFLSDLFETLIYRRLQLGYIHLAQVEPLFKWMKSGISEQFAHARHG